MGIIWNHFHGQGAHITDHTPGWAQSLAGNIVMEKTVLYVRRKDRKGRRKKVIKVNRDTRKKKPRLTEDHHMFNPRHNLKCSFCH